LSQTSTNNTILIEAVDNNISSAFLSQSVEIISNRLEDFSSERFIVNVIPGKNQIQVILDGNWDLEFTESLIIQKGSLIFYETFDRKSLLDVLQDDHHLF